MRLLMSVLLLGGLGCSAGATPEPTPRPREESPVVVPSPVEVDRSTRPPAAEPERGKALRGTFTFRCAGDRMIETDYAADGTVEIRWNGRWYTLRPREAASGALFANNSLRWHTKGNEGTLEERGRVVAADCAVKK